MGRRGNGGEWNGMIGAGWLDGGWQGKAKDYWGDTKKTKNLQLCRISTLT